MADREAWTHRREGADRCSIVIAMLVGAVLLAEVAVMCWAFAALVSATREALAARELMFHVARELRAPLDAILIRAANLRTSNPSTNACRDAEAIEKLAANMSALVVTVLDAGTLRDGGFKSRKAVGARVPFSRANPVRLARV